jgi:predicted DNA-binding WGR domain protein
MKCQKKIQGRGGRKRKCHMTAKRGKRYCYHHLPRRRAKKPKKRGKSASRRHSRSHGGHHGRGVTVVRIKLPSKLMYVYRGITDKGNPSFKMWIIKMSKGASFATFWGKVARKLQSKTKHFRSREAMLKAAVALAKSKQAKGYRLLAAG